MDNTNNIQKPNFGTEMTTAFLDLGLVRNTEDLDRIFAEFKDDLSPSDLMTFLIIIKSLLGTNSQNWYAGFLAATRYYKKLRVYEEAEKLGKMAMGD